MKFAYADPPYYGQGKRLYGDHPEAHVWDDKQTHLDLITRLHDQYPDGWALSCNPADLSWLLPHSPELRVCVWAKTFHQIRPLVSVQYAWEPVLVHGGRPVRKRKPMLRDWLPAARTMKKGTIGAKPAVFHRWVLGMLGYEHEQDTIDDLFPGSNGLAAVLAELAS